VRAAIGRLLPGAKIIRQHGRSREVADFVVRYKGSELLVETKWRSDPAQQFGGSTLHTLVQHLPPGASLLVIVNVPPMPRAYEIIKDAAGEQRRIVMWRNVSNDHDLEEALTSLLRSAAEPASQ
jgi:hypothetical protein